MTWKCHSEYSYSYCGRIKALKASQRFVSLTEFSTMYLSPFSTTELISITLQGLPTTLLETLQRVWGSGWRQLRREIKVWCTYVALNFLFLSLPLELRNVKEWVAVMTLPQMRPTTISHKRHTSSILTITSSPQAKDKGRTGTIPASLFISMVKTSRTGALSDVRKYNCFYFRCCNYKYDYYYDDSGCLCHFFKIIILTIINVLWVGEKHTFHFFFADKCANINLFISSNLHQSFFLSFPLGGYVSAACISRQGRDGRSDVWAVLSAVLTPCTGLRDNCL